MATSSKQIEYQEKMIKKHKSTVDNFKLIFYDNSTLKSLKFLNLFNLKELVIENCRNIVIDLENETITKLNIESSQLNSVKGIQNIKNTVMGGGIAFSCLLCEQLYIKIFCHFQCG
ncbi:Hypothetical_protein [Hexamita inflata]|uniref:Hypothetical_protein n=1 Tax=Hexamita inflata TaxID=28002 RepID=A0AA86R7V1_9EUKA|nr:Hypothetical protein HINF_LOCUS56516 [Hexamita inflata]